MTVLSCAEGRFLAGSSARHGAGGRDDPGMYLGNLSRNRGSLTAPDQRPAGAQTSTMSCSCGSRAGRVRRSGVKIGHNSRRPRHPPELWPLWQRLCGSWAADAATTLDVLLQRPPNQTHPCCPNETRPRIVIRLGAGAGAPRGDDRGRQGSASWGSIHGAEVERRQAQAGGTRACAGRVARPHLGPAWTRQPLLRIQRRTNLAKAHVVPWQRAPTSPFG